MTAPLMPRVGLALGSGSARRLAGEPPEVLVAPRLAHLRLFDFHRTKEAIEEGRRAVERVAHSLAVLNDQAP